MHDLQETHDKTRQAYNRAAQKYHELFRNEMSEKQYDRKLLDGFARRFAPGAMICDAGCGPSAQIGRYLFDKGFRVTAVDISDECVSLARRHNPEMTIERGDIAELPFEDASFEGVISYYSIIDTPKRHVGLLFAEFSRVLKPGGSLLVAVKEGTTEGLQTELLNIPVEIYFSLFTTDEIARYHREAGFRLEFLEVRDPYDFEIDNARIFTIGRKP